MPIYIYLAHILSLLKDMNAYPMAIFPIRAMMSQKPATQQIHSQTDSTHDEYESWILNSCNFNQPRHILTTKAKKATNDATK